MQLTATILGSAFLAASALAAPLEERHNNKFPGGRIVAEPKYFTSAVSTRAVPGAVIANDGTPTPGQANAFGHFSYKLNSNEDIICWDIRTVNVTGEYQSPAVTATHIHEGAVGAAGPPRIAFPNPQYVRNDITGAEIRETKGCLQGPFTTFAPPSTMPNSGAGFRVAQIEANPGAFFTDTHTAQFPAGAIRGQLLRSEVPVKRPAYFTSTLKTTARPDRVINANNASVPGLPGARSEYTLEINVDKDILCYEILSKGFQGEYFSPAKTATHTHQAAKGFNGPPRIAFKNPTEVKDRNLLKKFAHYLGLSKHDRNIRRSKACVKGPFTTGLLSATGVDTGSASGFTLRQLQDNPAGFFSDYHTEAFQAGAVRGQLRRA